MITNQKKKVFTIALCIKLSPGYEIIYKLKGWYIEYNWTFYKFCYDDGPTVQRRGRCLGESRSCSIFGFKILRTIIHINKILIALTRIYSLSSCRQLTYILMCLKIVSSKNQTITKFLF